MDKCNDNKSQSDRPQRMHSTASDRLAMVQKGGGTGTKGACSRYSPQLLSLFSPTSSTARQYVYGIRVKG